MVLVVVLQEWLCACADIVPAAVSPMANHTDDGRTAAAQNGAAHNSHPSPPPTPTPTPSAATSSNGGELQPDRLTPAALVAVHRIVLGLHTWALATDGGQPRAVSGAHMQPPNNTKTAADEYHQSQKHHKTHNQHQHMLDERNGDHDEDDDDDTDVHDNSPYTARRPTSLEFATSNNNVRRRTTCTTDTLALNNNNNESSIAAGALDNEWRAEQASAAAAALAKAKKRRSAPPKRAFGPGGQLLLVGIEEECEYDSDAGKFTCASGAVEDSSEEASSVVTTVSSGSAGEVTEFVEEEEEEEEEISGNETTLSMSDNDSAEPMLPQPVEMPVEKPEWCIGTAEERKRSTLLCVGAFLLTVVLLYWFPLPE